MTTEVDTYDVQVAALEATKACPCIIKSKHLKVGWSLPWHSCPDCNGTGRIFILDPDNEFGLRVKCTGIDGFCVRSDGLTCRECQNRGWIPNPDMAAWMRALDVLDHAGVYICFKGSHKGSRKGECWDVLVDVESFECVVEGDIELAFYTAIATSVDRVMRHHEYS